MNEQEIFEAALERDADLRAQYLDEACGADSELRQRIENLLKAHEQAGEFFERPAAEIVATAQMPDITEKPGAVIGPYKLLQKIGEGGFGVVYMADQTEPVKRRVALKIIKPGMDTREVIARFEAERQALAMMDHLNIAKILDAGTTESGRPYFVMDLVKGVPITQYCDEHHLTPRERLELFVPVCQAIQHAHQKGVIHRDIKPTNILVAEYDDRAVPKIIDFGVAKATEQRLTEKTLFTRFGQVVGTVDYMSPEQAKLNQFDIDTRSDIYSLGVVLYELLTGETPFDRQRLRSAAFDELLKILREEEPPRPSLRLSTSQSLPSIAANRHTEPSKLSTLVRGELDWIVMKALEKDRSRRYETANAFAADVQHYLQDEPVVACPPSAAYRFRKFARRNRRLVTTAAVMGSILLLATLVSTWQAVRATRARHEAGLAQREAEQERSTARQRADEAMAARAEAERAAAEAQQQRQRAEANLRLALEVLDEIYVRVTGKQPPGGEQDQSWKGPEGGSRAPARDGPGDAGQDDEALLERVLSFYERFAAANTGAAQLRGLVEEVYHKIVTARATLAEDSPGMVGHRRALGLAACGLASLLVNAGRNEEAERQYHDAISIQQQLVDTFSSVCEYREELAASHRGLAAALRGAGRDEAAKEHVATAGELERRPESPPKWRIDHSHFVDPTGLRLVGDAAVADRLLRLTPAHTYKRGAAWLTEKQGVGQGFETAFQFRMTGGADGLAFVIQNHDPSAIGPNGSGLGYGGVELHNGGIPNSLAVEFDTYSGVPITERAEPQHISVQTNGTAPNKAMAAFSLGVVTSPFRLDDGRVHTARVRYVPGTLTVFLDNERTAALTVLVELASILELDTGQAWVGFTAATGATRQAHEILGWRYCSLADPRAVLPWAQASPGRPPGADSARRDGAGPRAPREGGPPAGSWHLGFLQKALSLYNALAAERATDPGIRLGISRAYWRAGEIQEQLKDLEGAEAAYRAAVRILQELVDEFPNVPEYHQGLASGRFALAQATKTLGNALREQGKLEEALRLHEESVAAHQRLGGPEHPNTLGSMHSLANTLSRQGKLEEARKLYQEVLATQERIRPGHFHTLLLARNLAITLHKQGKFGEARELYTGALATRGRLLCEQGNYTEAESTLRECLAIREQTLSPGSPSYWLLPDVRSMLGGAVTGRGAALIESDVPAAESMFAEAESLLIESGGWLTRNADRIPQQVRDEQLRRALERIVELYEVWNTVAPDTGKAERAAEWRTELEKRDPALPRRPGARKLVALGRKSSWAPDGKRLVFARTHQGGLQILNLESGTISDLAAEGKDPAWSPDGRYVAYVSGPHDQVTRDEEVWLVEPDAGDVPPRRVAAGGFPCWSGDGGTLFVKSREDAKLLAIRVDDPGGKPAVHFEPIIGPFPDVSPDGRRVAFAAQGLLQVLDRDAGATLGTWPLPHPGANGIASWSPDGQQLAVGGFTHEVGLWVLDLARGGASRVADGAYGRPAWSRDGTKLSFDFLGRGDEKAEIWMIETQGLRTDGRAVAAHTGSQVATELGLSQFHRERNLAFDRFDGKLSLPWEIRNHDPSHVSLEKKPGMLTVTTQHADFERGRDDYKNLFLIQCPAKEGEDFEVTTCLAGFKPADPRQQVRLVCFDDEDNWVRCGYEMSAVAGRAVFYQQAETPRVVRARRVNAEAVYERLWLRVTKRGNIYLLAYSTDGEAYRAVTAMAWGDGSPEYVGLIASHGTTSGLPQRAPEIDTSFDFFELWSGTWRPQAERAAERRTELEELRGP